MELDFERRADLGSGNRGLDEYANTRGIGLFTPPDVGIGTPTSLTCMVPVCLAKPLARNYADLQVAMAQERIPSIAELTEGTEGLKGDGWSSFSIISTDHTAT